MMKENAHPAGYWTPEKLTEEGKKYQTKGEFKKHSPSAYATACRNGLIDSMTWFKNGRCKKRGPYKEHKYTKDIVAAIIKEHNCITVTDLRKVNEYAYKHARDNNWLPELGRRIRQTLWGGCISTNLKNCCQTEHDCQKVITFAP